MVINTEDLSIVHGPDSVVATESYQNTYTSELERIDRLISVAKRDVELHRINPELQKIYTRNLAKLEAERALYRQPFTADLEYRIKLKTEFPKTVLIDKGNANLRFHGTTLPAVKRIIESGVISSAVDHDGHQRSMDIAGNISVTDTQTINVTIKDYINLQTKSLPIGCVFVIRPQASEIESSAQTMTMSNTKLKTDTEVSHQFVCILCSPETITTVRGWLKNFGYPESLAIEYFELNAFTKIH